MLTELNPGVGCADHAYFSWEQRDCTRQIHDFVELHIAEHYTTLELAERFGISPTAMKQCFRAMYGAPIYTYFRTYRLQIAERLLRDGGLSVAEIAARIGYANPNKFTTAFRTEYGMTPTASSCSAQRICLSNISAGRYTIMKRNADISRMFTFA